MHHRTLILGLGNDILTDDAVGLVAARQLAVRFAEDPFVHVRETMEMGLALLDYIVGYDRVILLDAIRTGRAVPGSIHKLDDEELQSIQGPTPHFLGVGETLALGRQLGLAMPERVTILAVEIEDPFTLGTEMTSAVREAVPELVRCAAAMAVRMAMAWEEPHGSPLVVERPAWEV